MSLRKDPFVLQLRYDNDISFIFLFVNMSGFASWLDGHEPLEKQINAVAVDIMLGVAAFN